MKRLKQFVGRLKQYAHQKLHVPFACIVCRTKIQFTAVVYDVDRGKQKEQHKKHKKSNFIRTNNAIVWAWSPDIGRQLLLILFFGCDIMISLDLKKTNLNRL